MIKFFLIKFITFFLGFVSCYFMHTELLLPLVVAASLTGLVGTFIPFPKSLNEHPYASIYAGSFAGMCSSEMISENWEILCISFIGAILYVATMNLFLGFGGKLGGVAFVSIAIFILTKGLVL